MVKRCAWGTCNSDTRYKDKEYMKDVEFWPVPKPKTRLHDTKIWVQACGRKSFTVANVNKHAYVCSKHFVDGRPTDVHPYPVRADARGRVVSARKPPVRRELYTTCTSKSDKGTIINEQSILNEPVPAPADYVTIAADDDAPQKSETIDLISESDDNILQEGDDHAYCKQKQMATVSTQTNISLEDMSCYEDKHFHDTGNMKRKLLMDDVFKDDRSCKFYTGITLAIFITFFNILKSKASSMVYWNSADTSEPHDSMTPKRGPKRTLLLQEEFTLTLLRLRRGFDTKSLGNMFGISESSVCRIFTTWLSLMYVDLSFLIRWPTREQVRENMPKCFKYFKKTRCIIDCTEFFVQRPSLPSAQRITYSNYKYHNTFKCLVGVSPKGSFIFICDLFTGSITDKRIVQDSGFLNNIEFGDDIMADRGFLIRGELALKGATLNIPPFSMGKQMCSNATTKTRRIARARIHVERAIGRLKNFAILQGVIALSMKPLYTQIVKVCAMLCNLDKQLVK